VAKLQATSEPIAQGSARLGQLHPGTDRRTDGPIAISLNAPLRRGDIITTVADQQSQTSVIMCKPVVIRKIVNAYSTAEDDQATATEQIW